MTKTEKLNLNLMEPEDPVRLAPLNENFSALDAAVGEHATKLAGCGNCDIEIFTYTGTGSGGAVIAFPTVPTAYFILGADVFVAGIGGENFARSSGVGSSGTAANVYVTVTWDGSTASISGAINLILQANTNGNTYFVAALYAQTGE